MREGTVIFLEQEDGLESAFREKTKAYMADVIICGDKVVKNRWGKHGTIMEPYHALQQEECYKILLEIFNEIVTKKEIEAWKSYPRFLIKGVDKLF
jgi:hypothetical protein